ncbi:MAG: DUF3298 domain-containing protein [Clostridia bacterium]|nr:DUF3298 domain-containing protein [Clostridia bacterium]
MRKRFFAVLLCLLFIFSLAACDRTEKPEPINSNGDPGGEPGGSLPEKPSGGEGGNTEGGEDTPPEESAFLELSVGAVYDYEWDDELGMLASCTYPVVLLGESSVEKYPQLAAAVETRGREKRDAILDTFSELCTMAESDLRDAEEYGGGEFFASYEVSQEAYIRRADKKVLSMLYLWNYYGGGVHGSYSYWGESYDAATGRELALEDVIKDWDALAEAAKEQLAKYWQDLEPYDEYAIDNYFAEAKEYQSWVLDYSGVTLFFNPYDIAPYAYGAQTVTISFDEYPDLFVQDYRPEQTGYMVQMCLGDKLFCDLDNDGALDELIVSGRYIDDMYMYENQNIIINGEEHEGEVVSYYMEPVFVDCGEKKYLYVSKTYDNDYSMLSVYDVTGGKVREVGKYDLGWRSYGSEWDGQEYPAVLRPTDAARFTLNTTGLSFIFEDCFRSYRVGSGGVPESLEKYMQFRGESENRLTRRMELPLINEAGEPSGSVTLDEDARLRFWRTDGESCLDLITEDGETVRMEISVGDGMWYVGDAPIYEVLEEDWQMGGMSQWQPAGSWNPGVVQRQVLVDENCMCGVQLIGYVRPNAGNLYTDTHYYEGLLTASLCYENFPFMTSLPYDHFAEGYLGEQLYMIVPTDPNAKVEVYEWIIDESNDFQGERGQLLYLSADGAPFLLRCNRSDIMPDTQLVITQPDGEVLEWTPFVSLQDGRVQTVSNLKYVYDFTDYDGGCVVGYDGSVG